MEQELQEYRSHVESETESVHHDLRVDHSRLSTCQKELDSCRSELRDSFRDVGNNANRLASERDEMASERDGLARDLRACRDDLENAKGSKLGTAVTSNQEASTCLRRLHFAISTLRRLRQDAHVEALDAQAAIARLAVGSRALKARVQRIKDAIIYRLSVLEARVGASLEMHAEQAARLAADLGFEVELTELRNMAARELDLVVAKEQKEVDKGTVVKSSWQKIADFLSGRRQEKEKASKHLVRHTSSPPPAKPNQETCVVAIIPFRGRGVHLKIFFEHIAAFVEAAGNSKKCWSFYIVEQYDTGLFNRGWLFNVGYAMAQLEHRHFSCIAIQDLDTLPEVGSRVDYSDCPSPTQMSSEIQCYGWLPPYAENAGGVVTMSEQHWETINGFSNEYEGWGGEDDDLKHRLALLGLLRGTCGDFCDLTDRAFRPGQTNLIRRPSKGHGRFICLDEKSHTPRKHGDMRKMRDKLQAMEEGSDRWAFDGLSSLHFDLVRHYTSHFPNTTAQANLHWIKAVPNAAGHFGPERLRLVLADDACSERCRADKRCMGFPSRLPFSFSELKTEVAHVFRDCLTGGGADALGYWLIDRRIIGTALHDIKDLGAGAAAGSSGWDPHGSASWALNEVLREALDTPVDGDPALVARALPIGALSTSLRNMRSDPARQQPALVSVCVGIYHLDDTRIGTKHIVNVGSDDCEQRSWTHLTSFKALRRPRSNRDFPVCTAEASGTWTWRIGRGTNCSGNALGAIWEHRDIFYIGQDDAAGPLMCVRSKTEPKGRKKWSRWAVTPAHSDGSCGRRHDGYITEWTFRAMEDQYVPPRTYLCASTVQGKLKLELGCDPKAGGKVIAYAVLRYSTATSSDEAFCVGRSKLGDRIAQGSDCSSTQLGDDWSHAHVFSVPRSSTGRPWCVGRRIRSGISLSPTNSYFRVAPRTRCNSTVHGRNFEHVLSFREVALEEMTEDIVSLSLASSVPQV